MELPHQYSGYSNKFGLCDINLKEARERSDSVKFLDNSVKDFNEEELRVAIGLMAIMFEYEQKRLINSIMLNPRTLETIDMELLFQRRK